MSLALSRSLDSEPGQPQAGLNITVVFTSIGATIAAVKRAQVLAESLKARITLVAPQIVPFPLPLSSPPVPLEFQEKRLSEIAAASPVDISVKLYLCRDGVETLLKVLTPHSLIVVGGRRRFWPTRARRLATRLSRAGHEVIFTETN